MKSITESMMGSRAFLLVQVNLIYMVFLYQATCSWILKRWKVVGFIYFLSVYLSASHQVHLCIETFLMKMMTSHLHKTWYSTQFQHNEISFLAKFCRTASNTLYLGELKIKEVITNMYQVGHLCRWEKNIVSLWFPLSNNRLGSYMVMWIWHKVGLALLKLFLK